MLASERSLQGNNIHLYHQSTMAQQKSAQMSIYVDATLGIMHCRVLEVLQVSLTSHHPKSIAKCFIQAVGSRSARPPAFTKSIRNDLLVLLYNKNAHKQV